MATCTHAVANVNTANASSYASDAFVPAVGDLLIVLANASGTLTNPATLTSSIGGFTFTQFAVKTHTTTAAPADSLYGFVSDALVTDDSSQTVTIDVTGDNATGMTIAVLRVAGMTKVGLEAIRQIGVSNGSSSATPDAVFASGVALTGNVTIAAVGCRGLSPIVTEPTDWTERADLNHTSPNSGLEYATRDSGFTGDTITWGSLPSSSWGSLIVELDTSGAGGGPSIAPLAHYHNSLRD